MPTPIKIKDKLGKWLLTFAITAAIYIIAHHQATSWRGYEAVGGELLIWAMPAMLWALRRTVADWVAEIKEIWEEKKQWST